MSCLTLVLGAGASRGVSYADHQKPSPLDHDFFDLLQRLEPHPDDEAAKRFVLEQVSTLPPDVSQGMERSFYMLYLRAFLNRLLSGNSDRKAEELVGCFAHAIEAVLRTSHGTNTCDFHKHLAARLGGDDAVISFNYDLVIERAMRPVAEARNTQFTKAIYRFVGSPPHNLAIPKLLKLHGSSNWKIRSGKLSTRIQHWQEFDKQPQYFRHKLGGDEFPILLPFWDKQIENDTWLSLWKEAYSHLQNCDKIIVWGYSLPPTDIKARELFSLTVREHGESTKLCIIDPSEDTRQRWRALYPLAEHWFYGSVREFLESPPQWWQERTGTQLNSKTSIEEITNAESWSCNCVALPSEQKSNTNRGIKLLGLLAFSALIVGVLRPLFDLRRS